MEGEADWGGGVVREHELLVPTLVLGCVSGPCLELHKLPIIALRILHLRLLETLVKREHWLNRLADQLKLEAIR